MATTGRTILGVFDEPTMADQANDTLQAAGFRNDQILIPEHRTSGSFMSGLKSFFGGGDEAENDITDNLTAMGVSPDEAEYYENEHRAGRTVIAVQAEGREQEVIEILRTNGAQSYTPQSGMTASSASPGETLQTVTTGTGDDIATYARDKIAETTGPQVLRLRTERLTVNKEQVQTGEVIIRKEVITEQKTISVSVTREELVIERHTMSDGQRDTTQMSENEIIHLPLRENEVIRIPLSEERITVSKETVVTGEVSIGKRTVTEMQQITETVRHEEARVEQQGDAPIHDTTSDHVHPDSVDKDTLPSL